MIFTTECPSCESKFPIDSGKVPEGGVYARCSECSDAFLVVVPEPGETAAEAPHSGPPTQAYDDSAEGAPGTTSPATEEGDIVVDSAVALEVGPSDQAVEPAGAAAPEMVEQPAPADHLATAAAAAAVTPDVTPIEETDTVAEPESAPATSPVFGKRDPKERAARLARVLVSDMIAYHPERHRRSLAEGTLPQDFDEEIQKSWAEYVDQVGKDLAETTPYFRDALNQVLAQGGEVF